MSKENIRLQKEIQYLQKQLSFFQGPLKVEEDILYKKTSKGVKYCKHTKDKEWKKCCKNPYCWLLARKNGKCKSHEITKVSNTNIEAYYMTLSERRLCNPKCQYICKNSSSRNRKGKPCDRDAQYCRNDGTFVCINHVNVLKNRGATVYRKHDKVKIPKEIFDPDKCDLG